MKTQPKYDAYAALVANMVVSRTTGITRGAHNEPGSCNVGFDETGNNDDLVIQAAEILGKTPREFQEYAREYARGG